MGQFPVREAMERNIKEGREIFRLCPDCRKALDKNYQIEVVDMGKIYPENRKKIIIDPQFWRLEDISEGHAYVIFAGVGEVRVCDMVKKNNESQKAQSGFLYERLLTELRNLADRYVLEQQEIYSKEKDYILQSESNEFIGELETLERVVKDLGTIVKQGEDNEFRKS